MRLTEFSVNGEIHQTYTTGVISKLEQFLHINADGAASFFVTKVWYRASKSACSTSAAVRYVCVAEIMCSGIGGRYLAAVAI